MDKILATVLNAEAQADRIMEGAEQIKSDCERSIENADMIMGEYLNKSRAAVEQYRKECLDEEEAIKARIMDGLEVSLDRMCNTYHEKSDKWVDKMFADITKL